MSTHQHENWQIRESAKGGLYCAACGAAVEMTCDAVSYEEVLDADYEMEIRCTEPAAGVVRLLDNGFHPRCPQHVPARLR